MNKPLSLIVQDAQKEIVDIINNSKLSMYVIKVMLNDIYREVERVEQEEIKKYYEELEKNKEKESEKNGD